MHKNKLSLIIPSPSNEGSITFEHTCEFKFTGSTLFSSYAKIKLGTLVTPYGSDIRYIEKQGNGSVQSEIEIYQLLASNSKSVKKAILKAIFKHIDPCTHRLYLPLMQGASLGMQQSFLFNVLNQGDPPIATIWLYQQLLSILDTLGYLHSSVFNLDSVTYQGIIHGDIKPDNILIDGDGKLILADFGCAYPATKPAHQFGSLDYTAPELFANEEFTKEVIIDIDKSDLWSLGMTLYSVLNNKRPILFTSSPPSKKTQVNNFFKAHTPEIKHDYTKPDAIFLEDNLASFLELKQWGENYSNSTMADSARQSVNILAEKKPVRTGEKLTHLQILQHLSMAMLTPVKERPNAAWLLTQMQTLQPYCKVTDLKEKREQFILDLLANSPLQQSMQSPVNQMLTR